MSDRELRATMAATILGGLYAGPDCALCTSLRGESHEDAGAFALEAADGILGALEPADTSPASQERDEGETMAPQAWDTEASDTDPGMEDAARPSGGEGGCTCEAPDGDPALIANDCPVHNWRYGENVADSGGEGAPEPDGWRDALEYIAEVPCWIPEGCSGGIRERCLTCAARMALNDDTGAIAAMRMDDRAAVAALLEAVPVGLGNAVSSPELVELLGTPHPPLAALTRMKWRMVELGQLHVTPDRKWYRLPPEREAEAREPDAWAESDAPNLNREGDRWHSRKGRSSLYTVPVFFGTPGPDREAEIRAEVWERIRQIVDTPQDVGREAGLGFNDGWRALAAHIENELSPNRSDEP